MVIKIEQIVIRKPFEASSRQDDLVCPTDTRTKQSFKDECDVNRILDKWQKTGLVDHVMSNPPTYGDFSDVTDYQTAVNTVIQADSSFMALPSSIRSRFNNNPADFLDFVHNPENIQELVKMGLANPVQDIVSTDTITTTSSEVKTDV